MRRIPMLSAPHAEEMIMFEPVDIQVQQHKAAIKQAYEQGFKSNVNKKNPFSDKTQSSRYHAFNAGRYDRTRGFDYEELSL